MLSMSLLSRLERIITPTVEWRKQLWRDWVTANDHTADKLERRDSVVAILQSQNGPPPKFVLDIESGDAIHTPWRYKEVYYLYIKVYYLYT